MTAPRRQPDGYSCPAPDCQHWFGKRGGRRAKADAPPVRKGDLVFECSDCGGVSYVRP